MVPLWRTKGATPMSAAAALLLMRPSSGTPLGMAQIVALVDEVLHDGMDFPLRLAQGFQMSSDLLADVLALNCCEPTGLGVDHPPELIAAGSKLG